MWAVWLGGKASVPGTMGLAPMLWGNGENVTAPPNGWMMGPTGDYVALLMNTNWHPTDDSLTTYNPQLVKIKKDLQYPYLCEYELS